MQPNNYEITKPLTCDFFQKYTTPTTEKLKKINFSLYLTSQAPISTYYI